MSSPEIAQLELLASVDELVDKLNAWAEPGPDWAPLNQSRALIRRLQTRLKTLRIRLEAPLVVATFGGTGTGKSSLVNALVGQECTQSGRQRPTTTKPVLLVHPKTELEALGLSLDDFDIARVDSDILRDIVILDCPDPDTSEDDSSGSNLKRLRQLLPFCDALIYTSTQQKYRSSRVVEELGQAAAGCRLLFVQTHADMDEDVRDDWRKQLAPHYEVPDMYFVDSVQALQDAQSHIQPSGDFRRLQEVLLSQLSASHRIQIRRANLIDLIHDALIACRTQVNDGWPAVEELERNLKQQSDKLTQEMSTRLRDELLVSRNLWERRLLDAVTNIWGFSPFSSVLRLYSGMGNLLASMTLFRARNSAQVALIGAMQGARWLKNRQGEKEAEQQLERLATCGFNDNLLHESQIVVSGYVTGAQLDAALVNDNSQEHIRAEAARVEDQFLNAAEKQIDETIEQVADANSGWFTRAWYESAFSIYLAFVILRVGKNFFFDSFIGDEPLLTIDFYVSAGLFLLIWSGLLVMIFIHRIRRGLSKRIADVAANLTQFHLPAGLFPKLEQVCREIGHKRTQLDALLERTKTLRSRVAATPMLGAQVRIESIAEKSSIERPAPVD